MINFPFKTKLRKKLRSFIKNVIREETAHQFTSLDVRLSQMESQVLAKFAAIDMQLSQLQSQSETLIASIKEQLFQMKSQSETKYTSIEGLLSQMESQTEAKFASINEQFSQLKSQSEKQFASLDFDAKNFISRTQKSLLENFSCLKKHKQEKCGVVYTCITGDYDVPTIPEYINPDYEYVCFTDSQELIRLGNWGIWHIKPLAFSELDNTRNARWHKTHPHVLFPEYNISVWHDANITVRSKWIFEEIARHKEPLLIPLHFERNCIYDEIEACREGKRDDETAFNKMHEFLMQENFPKNYGLNETNLIVRRHNEGEVKELMEEWWTFIRNYTKRDQLSFSYVLYKHGITPAEIALPNLRNRYNDFLITLHIAPSTWEADLPDYPVIENNENLLSYIDIFKSSPSLSFVWGWATISGSNCRILIGTGSNIIYNYNPHESKMNIACRGVNLKTNFHIFKPESVKRPDVMAALNLSSDDVGFHFVLYEFLPSFTIYLVDDDEKKIYKKEIEYNGL